MPLTINTRRNFTHVGELVPRFASFDPRTPMFVGRVRGELRIDMRQTEFVWPSAMLWCAVYGRLATARGVPVELLVPGNVSTCTYLKTVGLFDDLREHGVTIDDRDVPLGSASQIVLPLSNFRDEAEVEDLAETALGRLAERGIGPANLRPVVSELFAELAMNAVQHSQSEIGAYGVVQFYHFAQGERFTMAVADGGIGIRRSLERNPELRERVPYDWTAIELAVKERISGTGEPRRGIGLYGVADDMRRVGRQLVIHSGQGVLSMGEETQSESRRTTLFPGTLAYGTMPAA